MHSFFVAFSVLHGAQVIDMSMVTPRAAGEHVPLDMRMYMCRIAGWIALRGRPFCEEVYR